MLTMLTTIHSDDLGHHQHDAVLGVPLHFLVVLLRQQRHQRQQPQIRQHNHHVAVARGSMLPGVASAIGVSFRQGNLARRTECPEFVAHGKLNF